MKESDDHITTLFLAAFGALVLLPIALVGFTLLTIFTLRSYGKNGVTTMQHTPPSNPPLLTTHGTGTTNGNRTATKQSSPCEHRAA